MKTAAYLPIVHLRDEDYYLDVRLDELRPVDRPCDSLPIGELTDKEYWQINTVIHDEESRLRHAA